MKLPASAWYVLVSLPIAAGCTGAAPPDRGNAPTTTPGAPSGGTASTTPTTSTPATSAPGANTPATSAPTTNPTPPAADAGRGTTTNPTASTDARPPSDGPAAGDAQHVHTGLPCGVSEILHARCHQCHGQPPLFGAPMALMDGDNFHKAALNPAQKVWQVAQARVQAGTMPPASAPPLGAAEKATLLSWLSAGAPVDPNAKCGHTAPAPGAAPRLPCTPNYSFRARGATADAPFAVPATPQNYYKCFNIASPFTKDEQAIAWAPVIDNAQVVHHWILYRVNGTSEDCDQSKLFLMGWAPGNDGFIMPGSIGYELPDPGQRMLLEVHYNNPMALRDAKDSSGVAVCTTKTPRPTAAGTVTFGRTGFTIPPNAVNHRVTGTCSALVTAVLREPLTVLSSWPHMHQLGRRFESDLVRLGTRTSLLRVDNFDFHNQIGYPHSNVVIRPGDEVSTTCVFTNPSANTVRYGERTEDEMCFNFAMVYPIGAASFLDAIPLRLCDNNL